MIERLIELSIRNRWLVIAAGLLLALGGLYAVYHTPVDAIPDLSENQVVVFTEWPGHSPPEIESQVTYPLSLHLQGLAGVRVVRSSSDFNFSMISIIFEDGVDLAAARDQVGQRLSRARDVLPPAVAPALAPDAAATGQIFWYTVEGAGSNLARLRAVQDWFVRPQMSSVPGVAEVASVGGFVGEYAIELDPRRLQALGVRLSDVLQAVPRANAAVGGDVIHKANAEYIVHGVGWLGQSAKENPDPDPQRVLRDLESILVPRSAGGSVRLAEVATVRLSPAPRRGVLEKDGNEVTGGVVLMRQGENALEVTRRLKEKIGELQAGLPPGVRIVPFYDRTPLIHGAIGTVTATLVEAIITATVCVLLVLVHFRTSFVIALTLPLSALASFLIMWFLRRLGIADIQTNIMSLAGIAISIGVLVDSSIVVAENVMHRLHEHFGDQPVTGDVREIVLSACRTVGRPIFFSVVIMLLSFLPVFALGGIEGKMFRPLAFTKCFALVAVAILAVTLVPALCTIFIRGRLRSEMDSWLVRGVISAYRPMLSFVLDRPVVIVWFVGVTFLVGLAPLGYRWLSLGMLAVALLGSLYAARRTRTRIAVVLTLVPIALVSQQLITPLGYEPITPLDEGMIMDMPITVPWASVAQAADDLKARDMLFCRFPEVDMVVGKAGRAETPTDPAPLDMIETMVNFRPQELWPRRKLHPTDAERQALSVLDALRTAHVIDNPGDEAARGGLINEAVMAVLPVFDAQMREYAYQRNQEFERGLGHVLIRAGREELAAFLYDNGSLPRRLMPIELERLNEPGPSGFALQLAHDLTPEDVALLARDTVGQLERLNFLSPDGDPLRYRPGLFRRAGIALGSLLGSTPPTLVSVLHEYLTSAQRGFWRQHIQKVNNELQERAAPLYTRLILEELLGRSTVIDAEAAENLQQRRHLRLESSTRSVVSDHHHHHHHGSSSAPPQVPSIDPYPSLDRVQVEQTRAFAARLLLWQADRSELAGFGGELDRVMQMPGWTNVWTMPIQNRVDMLSTGVNTTVGVRVLGRRLDDVIRASEEVAAVVGKVPGAVNVVADRLRGKGYLQVRPDRDRAARLGVRVEDINELVEVALGGKVATQTVEGRERHAVRVRYTPEWRADEESARALPVPVFNSPGRYVRLADVAEVRIAEGPATIKSENGLLRNYVRLNVRGRDSGEFVEEARRAVAARVQLPSGVFLEWTGQFEHEQRASNTLMWILPLVILLVFLVLWLTYHDLADALLMMVAVPGAFAGGVFALWLFGFKSSTTVRVGYIACIGMATATGIVMLVYLREAIARAGGLEKLTLEQLRQAVMDGAVHRLRPKLLTECTMILGLAPLLWNTGAGAEVIKPMVIPVLGGILIADEVIDLFLPVLFYWERRRRWWRLHQPTASPRTVLNGAVDARLLEVSG
ncbi:MAG TPA: efflux RND transporter permease subunit [Gemmataceae bacterium]|nr:efflux RND transporter permease subunit [Gemmataceae bacterium]